MSPTRSDSGRERGRKPSKAGRVGMITARIFWTLRHDRRSVAMMIVAPILAMLLFGLAFSGSIEDATVGVVNLDTGVTMNGQTVRFSEKVLELVDTDVVTIHFLDSMDDAVAEVESGDSYAAILFPANFSVLIMQYSMASQGSQGNQSTNSSIPVPAVLTIRSDASQVNVVAEINMEFQGAVREAVLGNSTGPVSVDNSDPVYGKNAEFIDMFVPGIMGFLIFLLTTILTLISFVGERTGGTLQRLLSTPVTEGEIVLGYAIAFSITGSIQVGILLALAILVFDILIVGNVVIAFLIAVLLAIVSVSLGILLSSAARRESQAIQFLPLIIMPVFLLSGVFWPLEAIPSWLRPVSYITPVTYAISALRSVLLRGWGLGQIWFELLMLVVFSIVFLAGAVVSLKRARGSG